MAHSHIADGQLVFVSAPFGRDAESVGQLLRERGYDVRIFASAAAMAPSIGDAVGAVLLTEEALGGGDLSALEGALRAQPEWSDLPFVLLSAARSKTGHAAGVTHLRLPDAATNCVVLERPLGSASLFSAVGSAIRLRQKQIEMRDRLDELHASRQALLASEAELRLIADSLPVLIGFIDRDLRYRFANKAYEDWTGQHPTEVLGRKVADVLGEEGFKLRLSALQRALAGEEIRIELPWPRVDGRRREAEIRYLPRRNAAGEVDGLHVFANDITDRKEIEEFLQQRVDERTAALDEEVANRAKAEAALRQSQKMEAVGQLTGGIAHDFNNMLTGVIGSLDIVRRRIADGRIDDIDRFMDAASTSAQRAAALTARLLAFSRRQSLDARPLDVNALALSLEDLLRRTISETIQLRIVPGEGLPPAFADANQLENAILNLAINARDAMPDGGQMTVETSSVEIDPRTTRSVPGLAAGRYVVIAVSDTGVGMSPDVLEKVFEPFFTTKPIGQGTGLGLSMIYGFARQSGGQVRVHSQPGQGTSVKIYLPVSDAAGAQAEVLPVHSIRQGQGQIVLVVEDDPSVRLLIRDVLAELSYQALEAADADAALPILRADRPLDLMVSDVGLPGMSGRQLAEVARQHRPDLPILFVTGYAENAAIRADFLGTNMAMITKPFALDRLATKIGEMIGHDG